MEKIKKKIYGMSLKRSLILVFITFVVCTGFLSSVTIFTSTKIQRHALDSRTLSFKAENGEKTEIGSVSYQINDQYEWSPLTIKQKLIYYGSIVIMVLLIVCYVVVGALVAGSFYYRIKLKKPLSLLRMGITNITEGNLDFRVGYQCDDEMGKLCGAVEKMVQELRHDKMKIWSLMEDRRALNASVSHDLGTPITVIKGYLEYLQKNIPKDRVTEDILLDTLDNMYEATHRLEMYTECVRNIQRIDDIEICPKRENLLIVLKEMESDFKNLEVKYGKKLYFYNTCKSVEVSLDKNQLFRIMENIVGNAFSFAHSRVVITANLHEGLLSLSVSDDGPGFSKTGIADATKLFYTTNRNQQNMGLGLHISKVLSEKHGGSIRVGNNDDGGGKVIVQIKTDEFG